MYEESIPADCSLQACAAALEQLECVAATDVTGPADPAGPTIEVTVPPAYVIQDRVPRRLFEAVYDREAPWTCGVVDVGRPAPQHLRVLVR